MDAIICILDTYPELLGAKQSSPRLTFLAFSHYVGLQQKLTGQLKSIDSFFKAR